MKVRQSDYGASSTRSATVAGKTAHPPPRAAARAQDARKERLETEDQFPNEAGNDEARHIGRAS